MEGDMISTNNEQIISEQNTFMPEEVNEQTVEQDIFVQQDVKIIKKSFPIWNVLLTILCILTAIMCLLPLYVMFINSTKTTEQINTTLGVGAFIPGVEIINNLKGVFSIEGFPIIRSFFNSLWLASASTVLCVYFSMLTAFGFVAYEFKGKKFLYMVVLVAMIVPTQLGMIGWYRLIAVILGLTNTYAGLIIPSIAAPTTVFFLKQYLETTYSKEIIEAARIDGSQEFMTFNRIVIPLSIPAMATMAIFSFVYSWNNYMGPLMVIDDTNKYTFPLLVQILKANPKFQDLALIYTSLLLITLPLLIVYLAFSKYIVGGVAIGGVKE